MKSPLIVGAALAAALAAPAAAQNRTGQVARDIAREIENTADAIGTVADAVDTSLGRQRWRSIERDAIGRCASRIGGRIRVEDVTPYGRRSLRVYGTVDSQATSWSRADRPRAFACTVRDDGRVRLKTRRLA